MVPLSSLSNMEAAAEDAGKFVAISPATPGRFRWVTTKNLQFQPTERLHRASSYTVKIKDGFTSVDGLQVPAQTYSFTTRPLRYESVTQSTNVSFDDPIRIFFNQPVDLARTQKKFHSLWLAVARYPLGLSLGTALSLIPTGARAQ